MVYRGKIETNVATAVITFTATTGEVFRLRPMGPPDADEQGHYVCYQEGQIEGPSWLLIDYEDEAELSQITPMAEAAFLA